MRVDLAIAGMGAVTPADIGVESLFTKTPKPQMSLPLGAPAKEFPVLRVDLKEPALVRWQKEPRLRRASPLTYFMVEAAAQALDGMPAGDRAQTGLVVALSAGCLLYSRKFFQAILKDGQHAASPALFPETVFNSPGSHVASVLGLNGAVYALCGDEAAWIAGLKTAAVWLRRDRVKQVVVMGVEEFDPLVLDAYRCARWLNQPGFLTSEGAAAILVRAAQSGDRLLISDVHESPPYRSPGELKAAAGGLFSGVDEAVPCHRTASASWAQKLESQVCGDRAEFATTPPPYLGFAVTASATWETIRAARLLTAPCGIVPIWGLNHRLGRINLTRR